MGRVRPFVRDDLPAVVALRQQAFRHRIRSDASLAAYMDDVFLRNPWRTDDLPSLVCEDSQGRVTGFLGVMARRVILRGQSFRMAVSTQLMTKENEAPAAVQLLVSFLRGPQDLSFADVSGAASATLWQRLGGTLLPTQRLGWTLPLRPARHYAVAAERRIGLRGLAFGLRPLTAAMDRAYTKHEIADDLVASDLSVETWASAPSVVLAADILRPDYDVPTVTWLLAQLKSRSDRPLHAVALRDREERLVGWYVYELNVGGVCDVVQAAASADRCADVVHHMVHHAWRHGGATLVGRVEPLLLSALADKRVTLNGDGPFVLFHSRCADVQAAADRGRVFLSRLEGEWWTSF